MTHRLSDSTIKEINEFFVEQNYTKNHHHYGCSESKLNDAPVMWLRLYRRQRFCHTCQFVMWNEV